MSSQKEPDPFLAVTPVGRLRPMTVWTSVLGSIRTPCSFAFLGIKLYLDLTQSFK